MTGGQASCDTMIPGDTIFFLIRMGLMLLLQRSASRKFILELLDTEFREREGSVIIIRKVLYSLHLSSWAFFAPLCGFS
jgi:hypothetical protein